MHIKACWKVVTLILTVSTLSYGKKDLQTRTQSVTPLYLNTANMANLGAISGISSKMSLYYALGFELILQANLATMVNNEDLQLYNHLMYCDNDAYKTSLHATFDEPTQPFLDPLAPIMSNIFEGNSGNYNF